MAKSLKISLKENEVEGIRIAFIIVIVVCVIVCGVRVCIYTCVFECECVDGCVCVSLSVSMCVHKCVCTRVQTCTRMVRAYLDFASMSRLQGSLGNVFYSSCPLPPNKQTKSFLQVFMEPVTHAPLPTSIWKSSDLANLERYGRMKALGAEGMPHMRMTVLQKHFLFFDARNIPVRCSQTELWPLALRKPRLRGDVIGPESSSQEAEADYEQALSIQVPAISALSSTAGTGSRQSRTGLRVGVDSSNLNNTDNHFM